MKLKCKKDKVIKMRKTKAKMKFPKKATIKKQRIPKQRIVKKF